ncbi:hypothetical protein DFH07DRAFT_770168 [Mycena maculata]|uniref:Uncharacterized protein n=1 Tax=Mycena maculata TaxID=230809 RepID=A0AAD7NL83_9AGAR|nr:hypothetical protein DFH07DRAFT_770168 [Mycena maculata]
MPARSKALQVRKLHAAATTVGFAMGLLPWMGSLEAWTVQMQRVGGLSRCWVGCSAVFRLSRRQLDKTEEHLLEVKNQSADLLATIFVQSPPSLTTGTMQEFPQELVDATIEAMDSDSDESVVTDALLACSLLVHASAGTADAGCLHHRDFSAHEIPRNAGKRMASRTSEYRFNLSEKGGRDTASGPMFWPLPNPGSVQFSFTGSGTADLFGAIAQSGWMRRINFSCCIFYQPFATFPISSTTIIEELHFNGVPDAMTMVVFLGKVVTITTLAAHGGEEFNAIMAMVPFLGIQRPDLTLDDAPDDDELQLPDLACMQGVDRFKMTVCLDGMNWDYLLPVIGAWLETVSLPTEWDLAVTLTADIKAEPSPVWWQ